MPSIWVEEGKDYLRSIPYINIWPFYKVTWNFHMERRSWRSCGLINLSPLCLLPFHPVTLVKCSDALLNPSSKHIVTAAATNRSLQSTKRTGIGDIARGINRVVWLVQATKGDAPKWSDAPEEIDTLLAALAPAAPQWSGAVWALWAQCTWLEAYSVTRPSK